MFKAPKVRINSWHSKKQADWIEITAKELDLTVSELMRAIVHRAIGDENMVPGESDDHN